MADGKRAATCHPDRSHAALGLCRKCYMAKWHRAKYTPSTNRRPWEQSIKSAAAARWANYTKITKAERRESRRPYLRDWYQKNKEKLEVRRRLRYFGDPELRKQKVLTAKKSHLRKKYGITLSEYERLVAEQGGLCFMCRQPSKLVIDHDHRTNTVRALLCDRCNRLLGVAQDDMELLNAAVSYLRGFRLGLTHRA